MGDAGGDAPQGDRATYVPASAEEPFRGTGSRRLLLPASRAFRVEATTERRGRSRSPYEDRDEDEQPRPSGSGIHQDDHAAISKIVQEEFKEISPDITKTYRKHAVDLAAKLVSLQKAYEREKRYSNDRAVLNEGRFPSGIKPFAVPFESVLLDTVMAPGRLHTIMIPEAKTIREARKIVYLEYNKIMRSYDELIVQAQIQELKRWCKLSSFLERCATPAKEKKSSSSILGLDEDDDVVAGPSPESMRARATILYKKTIDRIASEKMRREEDQRKSELREQKVIDRLLDKAPSEWLDLAIESKAKQLMKSKPTKESLAPGVAAQLAMGAGANARELITSSVKEPKNGVSPAQRGGAPTSQKGQAKGKDASAKGKGKGKDKNGSKSKSKGKGKSKDQAPQPKGSGKGKGKAGGRGNNKGKGAGKGKNAAKWGQ